MFEISVLAYTSTLLGAVIVGGVVGGAWVSWGLRRATEDAEEATFREVSDLKAVAVPPDHLPLPSRIAEKARELAKPWIDRATGEEIEFGRYLIDQSDIDSQFQRLWPGREKGRHAR